MRMLVHYRVKDIPEITRNPARTPGQGSDVYTNSQPGTDSCSRMFMPPHYSVTITEFDQYFHSFRLARKFRSEPPVSSIQAEWVCHRLVPATGQERGWRCIALTNDRARSGSCHGV